MRLINTRTYELEEFWTRAIPSYAILSHTWADGEVSYRDMQDRSTAETKPGYAKVKSTCHEALILGYGYAWVDTCEHTDYCGPFCGDSIEVALTRVAVRRYPRRRLLLWARITNKVAVCTTSLRLTA